MSTISLGNKGLDNWHGVALMIFRCVLAVRAKKLEILIFLGVDGTCSSILNDAAQF